MGGTQAPARSPVREPPGADPLAPIKPEAPAHGVSGLRRDAQRSCSGVSDQDTHCETGNVSCFKAECCGVTGHTAIDALDSGIGFDSDDPSKSYTHRKAPLLSQSSCGDTTSDEQPSLFVLLFVQFGRRSFILPLLQNANKECAIF